MGVGIPVWPVLDCLQLDAGWTCLSGCLGAGWLVYMPTMFLSMYCQQKRGPNSFARKGVFATDALSADLRVSGRGLWRRIVSGNPSALVVLFVVILVVHALFYMEWVVTLRIPNRGSVSAGRFGTRMLRIDWIPRECSPCVGVGMQSLCLAHRRSASDTGPALCLARPKACTEEAFAIDGFGFVRAQLFSHCLAGICVRC